MIGLRKYGPRTKEIKTLLRKFSDPQNKAARRVAFDLVNTRSLDWLERWKEADLAHHSAVTAYRLAPVELRVDRAVTTAFGKDGTSRLAIFAVAAVQAFGDRGMIGGEQPFTQKQYELLTSCLDTFLVLIESTPPGSPERDVACNLVTGGMSATEAVASAKRALLV